VSTSIHGGWFLRPIFHPEIFEDASLFPFPYIWPIPVFMNTPNRGRLFFFPDFVSGNLLSQFILQSYGACYSELKSIGTRGCSKKAGDGDFCSPMDMQPLIQNESFPVQSWTEVPGEPLRFIGCPTVVSTTAAAVLTAIARNCPICSPAQLRSTFGFDPHLICSHI
jgi:hypothetical protein